MINQPLLFIGEIILEKSHINVLYVATALNSIHSCNIIGEFILERNHVNVICVERPLGKKRGPSYWRETVYM